MGAHSRISFNVQKHVVKHPLKSTLHVIYKKLQRLLKCQKKGNLSVTCVCFKVSKSVDIPTINPTKEETEKCSLQILCFRNEIWASSSVSIVKLSLKDHPLNFFLLLESYFFFLALEATTITVLAVKHLSW